MFYNELKIGDVLWGNCKVLSIEKFPVKNGKPVDENKVRYIAVRYLDKNQYEHMATAPYYGENEVSSHAIVAEISLHLGQWLAVMSEDEKKKTLAGLKSLLTYQK